MMIDEKIVNRYSDMVNRVASDYARRFTMVDKDDIRQECWLWFIEHPNKTEEWIELPDKDGDRLFARSLRNAALRFCVAEKANITGYSVEDLFWYSADFIKELLPTVLSEDWSKAEKRYGQPSSHRPPAESGDWMAYAGDVARAYASLSSEEQMLVKRFYAEDVPADKLMEESERPTARAAMMAANRAVHKMVKFLGGTRPSRKEKDNQPVDKETE